MAITNTGAETCHFATSTTAATWGFTQPVKQVRVTNRGTTAGDILSVTLCTARTAAAVEGEIVTAVSLADETHIVMPGETKVIFKSPRATFVGGSIIAAANTPGASIEGSSWYE